MLGAKRGAYSVEAVVLEAGLSAVGLGGWAHSQLDHSFALWPGGQHRHQSRGCQSPLSKMWSKSHRTIGNGSCAVLQEVMPCTRLYLLCGGVSCP